MCWARFPFSSSAFLASLTLLLVSAAMLSASSPSAEQELAKLADEVDSFLEEDKFEEEMIAYGELLHVIQKSRLKPKQSAVLTQMANLFALIGQLKFAIKSKFSKVAKGDLLKRKLSESENVHLGELDVAEAKLIVSRAYMRCKLTIMSSTFLLWKRLMLIVRNYSGQLSEMKKILEIISESQLVKEEFSLEKEAEQVEKALKEYKELMSMDFIFNGNNVLEATDEFIDEAFACPDCSSKTKAVPNWAKAEVASLVFDEEDIYNFWLPEAVPKEYVAMLEDSESSLGEEYFSKPEEWFALSAEDVEQFRESLLKGEPVDKMGA